MSTSPLPPLPPLPPEVRRRPSVARWVVLGCGGAALAFAALVGLVVFGALKMMRGEAYEQALQRTRRHPAALQALGQPIEAGWLMTGSVNVNGPSGRASLAIPVSGPRQKGTLYVEAVKEVGVWELRRLELAPEAGARLDLR
jgi:hypothetical protein